METDSDPSLARGLEGVEGPTLLSYGDIIFKDYILNLLMQSEADITLVVDAKWREHRADAPKGAPDLVICSQPYAEDLFLDATPDELAALAGATLGFLRYNFNPASIFMGDSGSTFLGMLVVWLTIAISK